MTDPKSDIRHKIIGDLHHLLSIATPDDLIDAAQMCKSRNMREALQLLASELNSTQRSKRGRETARGGKRANTELNPSHRSNEGRQIPQDVKRIKLMLESSPFLESRHDVIDFVMEEGFKLPSDEKASRLRIIANLAKQISSKPKSEIARIFDLLGQKDGGNTSGWMNVIRNS